MKLSKLNINYIFKLIKGETKSDFSLWKSIGNALLSFNTS